MLVLVLVLVLVVEVVELGEWLSELLRAIATLALVKRYIDGADDEDDAVVGIGRVTPTRASPSSSAVLLLVPVVLSVVGQTVAAAHRDDSSILAIADRSPFAPPSKT